MERAQLPYQPELPGMPEAQEPFEYKLLVGHNRTDGTPKSTEELQREYVRLTDGLVYKMTEGVDVVNRQTGEKEHKVPDYVVWLDKSARPLEWLTRDLWPTLASRPDGSVAKMPQMRFVNIDREQWLGTVDPEETGKMDISKVAQNQIRSLRSVFAKDMTALPETLNDPSLDTMETVLDDKTVMIVDEVRSSGRTLAIAQGMFERAFPTTSVATAHWMGGMAMKNGATGNADLPVWYRADTPLGRGVADRDLSRSQESPSRTQQLGRWFLSTGLRRGPDALSNQLRQELGQLAKDVQDHKVLVVPSAEWNVDDAVERATRLNDMTLPEYTAARRAEQDQSRR